MKNSLKKQTGFGLLQAMFAVAIMGLLFNQWTQRQMADMRRQEVDIQSKQVAEIANALVRYQSSAGDAANGLLSPAEQFDQNGKPFKDGAVHYNLDWLKSSDCANGVGTAPSGTVYLACEYEDFILIGDNTTYKFTVNNDGTVVTTTMQLLSADDESKGIVIDGQVDTVKSALLASATESKITFSSSGAVNTFVNADPDSGIITIEVGLDIANSPYQRRDGINSITGTEHFANNAGIVFDTPADIEGVQVSSAERFASYDRATNTVSDTRYMNPAGQSIFEDIEVANAAKTKFLEAEQAN
ncbi:pilus assembly FimT family protein, partial [Vibrio sp. Hal054]|uniref:pilus assembly FimT family protein n=1 Tax=Vibrio sp. Hal054 TaxID=3035158 RepID=UPI003056325E